MKKLFLVFAGIFITAATALAQSYPIPEFDYQPNYVDGTDAKALEKIEGVVDNKPGFGKMTEYVSAFGKASALRFKKESVPVFIIRVEAGDDPSTGIELVKAEIKNDRRRFLQFTLSLRGANDPRQYTVPISFKKVADNIYQIIVTGDLQPGEYAFRPIIETGNYTRTRGLLYCFGID